MCVKSYSFWMQYDTLDVKTGVLGDMKPCFLKEGHHLFGGPAFPVPSALEMEALCSNEMCSDI
jgi:hypothetical protein